MNRPAGTEPSPPEGEGDPVRVLLPEGTRAEEQGEATRVLPAAQLPGGQSGPSPRPAHLLPPGMEVGKKRLSRRALLSRVLMGTAAAGAAAVLGTFVVEEATGKKGSAPTGATVNSTSPVGTGQGTGANPPVPLLASTPSILTDGPAQVFRSRPDLRPPTITVDLPYADFGSDLILTECHAGPTAQGPMIIDGNGDLVWFLSLSPTNDTQLRAFNVQTFSYQGQAVLAMFRGEVVNAHGQGFYELYDTSYNKIAEVHGQNGYQGDLHEFFITPEGSAIFTCYGQVNTDLSQYGGSDKGIYFYGVAQEVDIKTGKLLFEWRSDDHIALDESYVSATPTSAWDYFHINSICIDPADGNLIISGRNTWAFYKVERTSGAVLWRLGGRQSDFTIGTGAGFAFQHDVNRHADGTVTMFDNEGGPPAEASQSRGLVLSVDETTHQADLVAQYFHTPPVMSYALGNVQDLSGGERFIGWGDSAYFSQYDATGKVVFDAQLARGTESYRAFKQAWVGQPLDKPAVSVALASGSVPTSAAATATASPGAPTSATVYVSWNGATEVANWVVLGGSSAGDLAPVGSALRQGFETAITVPDPPAYVAVEAQAANGTVLGRSETAQLT